jgi:hypothetical protein
MERTAPCRECDAIAEELALAYAEAWDSADPHSRRAWRALLSMRTEDDVQRAEELLQSKPQAGLRDTVELGELVRKLSRSPILCALQKKAAHETRTGHKVRWGSN